MGSSPSPPSAPTTYIPTPAAPTLYQSVIPKESYQQAGDYLKRINEQLNAALTEQEKQVGTSAQQGARNAGLMAQQAASYAGSIPVTDKYLQQTTGSSDVNATARLAANQNAANLQQQYEQKLSQQNTPSPSIPFTMPSWSQGVNTTVSGGDSGNNNDNKDNKKNKERDRYLKGVKKSSRYRQPNLGSMNTQSRPGTSRTQSGSFG